MKISADVKCHNVILNINVKCVTTISLYIRSCISFIASGVELKVRPHRALRYVRYVRYLRCVHSATQVT
jgi:hypothetical protein